MLCSTKTASLVFFVGIAWFGTKAHSSAEETGRIIFENPCGKILGHVFRAKATTYGDYFTNPVADIVKPFLHENFSSTNSSQTYERIRLSSKISPQDSFYSNIQLYAYEPVANKINELIRDGKPLSGKIEMPIGSNLLLPFDENAPSERSIDLATVHQSLQQAFEKGEPLKTSDTLFRGTILSEANQLGRVGDTVKWDGYTSTTTDFDVASRFFGTDKLPNAYPYSWWPEAQKVPDRKGVVLSVITPGNGWKGVVLDSMHPTGPSLSEILLPPQTTGEITRVEYFTGSDHDFIIQYIRGN